MSTVMLAGLRGEWGEELVEFLSDHGCRVETADNGLDCLTRMRTSMPELLVLAASLPWGGGDGVLAVMQGDPWLSQIPVVYTHRDGDHLGSAGMSAPPVVRVLGSPFPPAELLAVLNGRDATTEPADRFEVLVADDDPHVRELLREYLEGQGFRVWAAGNGEEALNLCCEHGEHIAVALLDVHMPALDGPHTFEGLRAYDPSLPVCFMTGGLTEAEAADLLRFGARHVFRKPFRLEDVGRVVRALANGPRAVPQEA